MIPSHMCKKTFLKKHAHHIEIVMQWLNELASRAKDLANVKTVNAIHMSEVLFLQHPLTLFRLPVSRMQQLPMPQGCQKILKACQHGFGGQRLKYVEICWNAAEMCPSPNSEAWLWPRVCFSFARWWAWSSHGSLASDDFLRSAMSGPGWSMLKSGDQAE